MIEAILILMDTVINGFIMEKNFQDIDFKNRSLCTMIIS